MIAESPRCRICWSPAHTGSGKSVAINTMILSILYRMNRRNAASS